MFSKSVKITVIAGNTINSFEHVPAETLEYSNNNCHFFDKDGLFHFYQGCIISAHEEAKPDSSGLPSDLIE